jgi:DNA-binding LytR/AlgR family response regulator
MARRDRVSNEGRGVKLRVIVVDDEPLARRRLATMVDRTDIAEMVGEAGNADQAMAAITKLDPDVILLDVRMPGTTGVELARELGERPIVVFTTAYAEHAVDAFETAAADYLLKPVEPAKLARALDRAAGRLSGKRSDGEPRIAARGGDVLHVFAASRITRFRAEDKYTVFVVDGVEHLIEEALSDLEARLAAWGFVRVHRGELVQASRIRALDLRDGLPEIELDDGQRVRVSRRLLPAVRKRLAK